MSPDLSPAGPDGEVPSDLAERLAVAAQEVPGVVGLHSGLFGEIATYLPGKRVSGVSLNDEAGEIHIVVDLGHHLRTVAEKVRDTAENIAGRPVAVTIADISVVPTPTPAPTQPTAPTTAPTEGDTW